MAQCMWSCRGECALHILVALNDAVFTHFPTLLPSHPHTRYHNKLHDAFYAAAEELGHKANPGPSSVTVLP